MKTRRSRKEIEKLLYKLDKQNLAIGLQKCEFLQTEITWLGYKINSNGIIPKERKTNAITQMETPHTH